MADDLKLSLKLTVDQANALVKLGEAARTLTDFAKQGEAAGQRVAEGFAKARAALESITKTKVGETARQLGDVAKQGEAAGQRVSAGFSKARAALDSVSATKIGGTARQLSDLGKQGELAGQRIAGGFSKTRAGLDSISSALSRARRDILGFIGLKLGLSGAKDIFNTAAQAEQFSNALKSVRGSAAGAQESLAFVRAESDHLGLKIETATEQFISLVAAAQDVKGGYELVKEVFLGVSEAAVVLGLSNERLKLSLIAVQQIISKGVVSKEELSQQLGESLYGAFTKAAKAVGVSTAELNDALQQGSLRSAAFLQAFARQLRTDFAGGVEGASRSARAALARFENSVRDLKLEFARSGVMDAFVAALRKMGGALSDPKTVSGLKNFGEFVGTTLKYMVDHWKEISVVLAGFGGAQLGALGGVRGKLIGAAAGAATMAFAVSGIGDAAEASDRGVADLSARIAALRRQIESLDARKSFGTPAEIARNSAILAEQRQKLAALKAAARSPGAAGAESGDFGPAIDYKSQLDTFLNEFALGEEKVQQKIAEFKALAAKAGLSQEAIAAGVAKIRRKILGDGSAEINAALTAAKAQAEAELQVLQSGLDRQKAALERAFDDKLISLRQYYSEKTRLDQAAIDDETAAKQQELAAQAQLTSGGKDGAARLRAKGEVARLEGELIVLNNKRAEIEQKNAHDSAKAERELSDKLAAARDQLTQITSTDTADSRRAAVAREFKDFRRQLVSENNQAGVDIIDQLINVKAAQANLDKLEAAWRVTTERLANAQQAIQTQQQAGLLTESQARQKIIALQQQSAVEMERLLPAMQAAAEAIGPEAVVRVQAWKNELASTKLVIDEVAVRLNGELRDSFATLFGDLAKGAKSTKEIFLDFLASVEASISKIASQKLAEKLFGAIGGGDSGGIGGFISKLFSGKGFAVGGFVVGPGTATSDSIPARLSAGEYVVNAAAVRRLGVTVLDALNGGAFAPLLAGPRFAFADGGLVPTGAHSGQVFNMNINIATPDAQSFRRSRGQLESDLRISAERGLRNL